MKKIISIISLLLIGLMFSSCEKQKDDARIFGVINEMSYYVDEYYDPLDGITAFDESGNDVTHLIEIIGYIPIEDGFLKETGTFEYELCVIIDDIQILSEKVVLNVEELPVIIEDKEKPIINVNNTIILMVGDKLEFNVSGIDNIDGDITDKINYNGLSDIPCDSAGKLTTAGTYYITLVLSDNAQNKTSKEICLIVKEPEVYGDIIRNEIYSEEYKDIDNKVMLGKYKLVWADEFDYVGLPSDDNWSYDIGTGSWGWGNNEKQYYTNDPKNVYVENGVLRISAIKELINGSEYSSTRIKSINKADFKYGYIEASIMQPIGGGAWPAFWMMPTKSVYGGWPASGEIDIMEYVCNNPNRYMGTVHNQKYHGGTSKSSGYISGSNLDTEFHKYAIEWTPDFIKFYFDDEEYYSYSNPNRLSDNYKEWPYDQEFYFILNVAVGGTLGGGISSSFSKSTMLVDYVRVYQTDYTGSDKISPEVVNLRYTSTSNSISLDWDKVEDNVGLYHYEIIVNGVQYAATNKLNYTINNLNPNTTYYIQVLAVDLNDNCSSSGEMIITTK